MEECEWVYGRDYPDDVLLMSNESAEFISNDELVIVKGLSGSGKSRFIMSLIAGLSGYDSMEGVLFNPCPSDKKIILISTEMSWGHIVKRGNGLIAAVGNANSVRILNTKGRKREYILTELDAYLNRNRPYIIIIDHLLNAVKDMNNMETASDTEDWLKFISNKYGCPIVGVIHQNPNALPNSKAGGNIGSILERAASCVFAVTKNESKNIWSITTTKVREGLSGNVWEGRFNDSYQLLDMDIKKNAQGIHELEKGSSLFDQIVFPGNKSNICSQISRITGKKSLITNKKTIEEWKLAGLVNEIKNGINTVIYKN